MLLYFVVFGPTIDTWGSKGWVTFSVAAAGLVGAMYAAKSLSPKTLPWL